MCSESYQYKFRRLIGDREVELSGAAVIYLLRFGGQLAGSTPPRPGGRPRVEASRAPPHTHVPQLLRYRIGAYGREATRVPLFF